MKILSLVLLILLTSNVLAQEPANQPKSVGQEALERKAFTRAERVGEDRWRTFFTFSAGGRDYLIRADGHGESADGKARPRNFDLKLGRNGHMERLYFLEHEGDLLLIFEASDAGYGWGFVEKLNQKTLKPRWIASVSGFNLGPGLIDGNYVYLTATDLLAKIDLRSGDYVWQQEAFQKQYALSLSGFRLPTITEERVYFPEAAERGKTIEVDKTTGKILTVKN